MSNWRDDGDAVLNAVLGDHLAERGNGIAKPMALYDRGRPVVELPADATRLVVLVHGMACTERSWAFPDDPERDYGRTLAASHGLTPIYVRYNSGLPIWRSGEALRKLLTSIVERVAVEEINLIGHSMGGLVIRSACHHGREDRWSSLVRRAFYVGSPHAGAPAEKAGRVASAALQAVPDPIVKLLGDIAQLRSAAVKDLGDGDIIETKARVPFDDRHEHFLVAGTLPNAAAVVLGDGMVRVKSAAGMTATDVVVFRGLGHMTLAHHPDVEAWIADRCGPRRETAASLPESSDDERTSAAPYVDLLQEAIDVGSTSIQQVHEAIAARPYDVLEQIPELAAPSRAVRAVHFGVIRGTYSALRWLNTLTRS